MKTEKEVEELLESYKEIRNYGSINKIAVEAVISILEKVLDLDN